jgi:hypothetical protein
MVTEKTNQEETGGDVVARQLVNKGRGCGG